MIPELAAYDLPVCRSSVKDSLVRNVVRGNKPRRSSAPLLLKANAQQEKAPHTQHTLPHDITHGNSATILGGRPGTVQHTKAANAKTASGEKARLNLTRVGVFGDFRVVLTAALDVRDPEVHKHLLDSLSEAGGRWNGGRQ